MAKGQQPKPPKRKKSRALHISRRNAARALQILDEIEDLAIGRGWYMSNGELRQRLRELHAELAYLTRRWRK